MDVRKARPRWILPPGQTSIYGWEYPCLRHVLFLRIFNPKVPEKKFCCEVYLDKVLDGDVIDMGKGNGRVSTRCLVYVHHLRIGCIDDVVLPSISYIDLSESLGGRWLEDSKDCYLKEYISPTTPTLPKRINIASFVTWSGD